MIDHYDTDHLGDSWLIGMREFLERASDEDIERHTDHLGEAAPWIVEEPEDWRTRTSEDSRRLRRACAVYGGGLLVGLLLVRLAIALAGVLG